MMGTMDRLARRTGEGPLVVILMVCGSGASTLSMLLKYREYDDGLLGTLGTRSYVNRTSSAVNGEPSENFTSLRRLNVHTLPSTVQDSANEGKDRKSTRL